MLHIQIPLCIKVTNKRGISGDYSMEPICTTPVNTGSYVWEPEEVEQPLKTEGCGASYDSRQMIGKFKYTQLCLQNK